MEQVRAFLNQATEQISAGKFEEALAFLEQALVLDSNEAEGHILRGVCLANLGRNQEATTAFRQAVGLAPTNPKALYNLALHLQNQGQSEEAKGLAEAALQRDPNHEGARELLRRVAPTTFAAPPTPGYGPTPPPSAPSPAGHYYREGYDDRGPTHTLGWVENLGASWSMIGWAVVVIGAVLSVYGLVVSWPLMNEIFANMNNPEKVQEIVQKFQGGGGGVMTFLSYGSMAGAWIWMIIDIIDRRSSWLWLIPMMICCCCGFPWASMGIYMASGRN